MSWILKDNLRAYAKKSAVGSTLGAFFMPLLVALLAALFLTTTSCGAEIPPNTPVETTNCPPFAKPRQVTIDNVVDGDTVRLADGSKVRLIGINTPELARDGKSDQPFAKQAKQQLDKFLGTHALLLTDKEYKDRHGRILAHLYNLDGISAEAHLLRLGLAWHVAVPPNLTQAECLARAEQTARTQRINLWRSTGTAATPAEEVTEGGFQRITGRITKISFSKRGWWINMGNQIAAVIYPENQHRFDRKQLMALEGKVITIRGWVYPSRSKKYQPWRVKLETPYALTN